MTTDGGIFKTDDDVSLHFRATSQARAVHDARMAVDAAKEKLADAEREFRNTQLDLAEVRAEKASERGKPYASATIPVGFLSSAQLTIGHVLGDLAKRLEESAEYHQVDSANLELWRKPGAGTAPEWNMTGDWGFFVGDTSELPRRGWVPIAKLD